MKFFADTASLSEIDYCFSRGVDDGITTNPKIMELTGDLSLGFEGACKKILQKYLHVPVSLETDLRGIDVCNLSSENPNKVKDILLSQAYKISSWGKNVVVKIPVCEGGILAVEELSKKGIRTNVTACMTPYQALKSASAGATYVSLFANRMLDSNILEMSGHSLEEIIKQKDCKQIIKDNFEKYLEPAWEKVLSDISYVARNLEGSSSELIVGSIRNTEDVKRIALALPQVITIPFKIVEKLENIRELKATGLSHPMTQYTIEEFERAAEIYRK
jgi:transaldolase